MVLKSFLAKKEVHDSFETKH